MTRISGAIQVLEEELAKADQLGNGGIKVGAGDGVAWPSRPAARLRLSTPRRRTGLQDMSAYVCAAMRKIWRKAGLYQSQSPTMQSFLAFDSESDWERGLQEFRDKHYGLFDQIVPPLLQSEDKLLRLLLIRHADVSKRRELNLLKRLAQTADPIRDEPELLAILALGHKSLDREIRDRADLTANLRQAVGPQACRVASAHGAAARPAARGVALGKVAAAARPARAWPGDSRGSGAGAPGRGRSRTPPETCRGQEAGILLGVLGLPRHHVAPFPGGEVLAMPAHLTGMEPRSGHLAQLRVTGCIAGRAWGAVGLAVQDLYNPLGTIEAQAASHMFHWTHARSPSARSATDSSNMGKASSARPVRVEAWPSRPAGPDRTGSSATPAAERDGARMSLQEQILQGQPAVRAGLRSSSAMAFLGIDARLAPARRRTAPREQETMAVLGMRQRDVHLPDLAAPLQDPSENLSRLVHRRERRGPSQRALAPLGTAARRQSREFDPTNRPCSSAAGTRWARHIC